MEDRPYNRIRDAIEGLTILMRHGGTNMDSQYDELSAAQKSGEFLSMDEIHKMLVAGWFINSAYCDCGIDIPKEGFPDDGVHHHKSNCTGWSLNT